MNDMYDESTNPSNGDDDWNDVRDDVVDALTDAQQLVRDAIDRLRAARDMSRDNDGPYWLHGQLDAYTIPWLIAFTDPDDRQTGNVGGLIDALLNDDER